MPIVQSQGNALRPFDYGKAVQAGQQIRNNAVRNRAADLDLEEAEELERRRKEVAKITKAFEKAPERIAALEKAGMTAEADQLRQSSLTMAKTTLDMMVTERQGVTAQNYKAWKENKIKAGVDPTLFPLEYSDAWFKKEIATRARTVNKLTRKSADAKGNVISQDQMYEDGELTWEGDPYQNPDDMPNNGKPMEDPNAPFVVKSGDSGAIERKLVTLLGGRYDPVSGQLTGLDKNATEKLATIDREAARIYAAGRGAIPHAEAVAQAAQKFGYNIPAVDGPTDVDPLGINHLRKPK